ncbi:hypothetical protein AC579_6032 [Lecanosticta acicola]|uniref:DUF7053 domain-containing protein n=1 Tax=Lecanosticta acicola TaxID=111012 RepID=A0AAI9E9E8_9PEZI|nr:hypothetical protein AC579_6032 [Lecanosticta acicola]
MSKRSLLTHITPLPPSISRQTAIAQLHDHASMIKLNPLVLRHEECPPPKAASPDEAAHAIWYQITDQITYLPYIPGMKGEVVYKACFYNLPNGLQTHTFAPAGVDIRGKWTVRGNMPGEPREERELGEVDVPREGLYVREEVDLSCSIFMSAFIRRSIKKAHGEMAEKLIARAKEMQESGQFPTATEAAGRSQSQAPVATGQPQTTVAGTGGERGGGGEQDGSLQQHGLALNHRTTLHHSYVPHCACEGTAHGRSCPLFTPSDTYRQSYFDPQLKPGIHPTPFYPPSVPSSLSHSQSSSASHSFERGHPQELYGSAGMNQCLCTGGLHEDGCAFYPGLRLPGLTPSSLPATPSASSALQSRPMSPLPPPQPRHSEDILSSGLGQDWIPQGHVALAELSANRASLDVESRGPLTPHFSRPFRNG